MDLAEPGYQKFTSSLIPGCDHILGVRLPAIRKLAREIAKKDFRAFMASAESTYHEEILLQAMVLGYATADVEEMLAFVSDFIPLISNWAVCDSFCCGLKFTERNRERVWDFLMPCFSSVSEFEIRFGVVMLLSYYIVDDYIDRVLTILDTLRHDGYYVKMAVAWTLSVCFVKMPDKTMACLKTSSLDNFTYNKTLQKITESFRVDKDTKALIRSMKRF